MNQKNVSVAVPCALCTGYYVQWFDVLIQAVT